MSERRISLKQYGAKDYERLRYLLTNEKIKKTFMIPDFRSEEEVSKMIDKIINWSLDENHFERGIYLEDRLIGFINDVEIENKKIEVGYVIDPLFWNNGYGTEALQEAIMQLFQMGFLEISAGAFDENPGSFRVMEKCGMKRLNQKDSIEYGGIWHTCSYYSIKKNQ